MPFINVPEQFQLLYLEGRFRQVSTGAAIRGLRGKSKGHQAGHSRT